MPRAVNSAAICRADMPAPFNKDWRELTFGEEGRAFP
jgi:hypothetical protein